MTTQIEALKKALGKIKSARDCHFAAIDTLLFEAEEILESALAEQPAPVQPCPHNHTIGDGSPENTFCYDCKTFINRAELAEQPAQQEPFGHFRYDIRLDAWVKSKEANVGVEFYTEPPKREWVALTEDEIFKLYMGSGCTDIEDCEGFEKVTKVVEAKLKEKNT